MKADAAIIGMGYVGMPLAHRASMSGLKIIGFDTNSERVADLQQGISYIDDLTDADIRDMLARAFLPTTNPALLGDCPVIVICVPTPLSDDGGPDLRFVETAVETIADVLTTGTTVILESTTYPGTTDEIVKPVLERHGLAVGVDFHLAFSPERIDPGRSDYGIANTPKVVGGCTETCAEKARAFYSRFVNDVVMVKGTREAEMTKLLENTYRHVNIALVNEMSRFCHDLGIDLWEVIRAASTKPFGFQAFYPGPGVGGHCIPIDPNYLSHRVRSKLKYQFRFVELAQDINASMPSYVVARLQSLLNDEFKPLRGSTILLLGVTYKANIADQRESPATDVCRLLRTAGACVLFHDPLAEHWSVDGCSIERVADVSSMLPEVDACLLLQNHDGYASLPVETAGLVLDTRGALPRLPNVVRL